jgi:hypothetical protein
MIENSKFLRNKLVQNLIKDILGPDLDQDGNEILDEELILDGTYSVPTTRYITGYLSPQDWSEGEENIGNDSSISTSIVSSDNNEISIEENEENESEEKGITQGKTMQNPSSMGISFVISKKSSEFIHICFNWGRI